MFYLFLTIICSECKNTIDTKIIYYIYYNIQLYTHTFNFTGKIWFDIFLVLVRKYVKPIFP